MVKVLNKSKSVDTYDELLQKRVSDYDTSRTVKSALYLKVK